MVTKITPHFTVKSYTSSDHALHAAARFLQKLFVAHRQDQILFLATGGTSMTLLSMVDPSVLGSHVTLSVTDDRWNDDPKVNNFAQIMAKPLYVVGKKYGCQVIDTRPHKGEPAKAIGKKFDSEIKQWIKHAPHGVVFVTQGIGTDGHTFGMLPHPENPNLFKTLFEGQSSWAVGYNAQTKSEYPERITINLPFLRQRVTQSIVYMVGENKKQALNKILNKNGDLAITPGRIVREINKVDLFTDIVI